MVHQRDPNRSRLIPLLFIIFVIGVLVFFLICAAAARARKHKREQFLREQMELKNQLRDKANVSNEATK
jgi:uncharacterized membrane protein YciS (DUF1049 family)